MTGSRAIAFCCFSFLILPLTSRSQSRLSDAEVSTNGTFGPTVSVRELSIPEKAKQAFRKGTERLAKKDWAGGIMEFQKAVAAFGGLYEGYYKIGIAELELQKTEEAETAFRKAIELSDGRYAPPLFALGLTLSTLGQHADAEAVVRAGLTLEPMDAAGQFTMAWVEYSAQKVGDAEKSAREAVRRSPNFAMAYLLLGQIHRRQNNLPALVEDLNAFLRLDPNGPRSPSARAVLAAAERSLQRSETASISDGAL
jgi:tetratricopeptide (TPR) repeat protein